MNKKEAGVSRSSFIKTCGGVILVGLFDDEHLLWNKIAAAQSHSGSSYRSLLITPTIRIRSNHDLNDLLVLGGRAFRRFENVSLSMTHANTNRDSFAQWSHSGQPATMHTNFFNQYGNYFRYLGYTGTYSWQPGNSWSYNEYSPSLSHLQGVSQPALNSFITHYGSQSNQFYGPMVRWLGGNNGFSTTLYNAAAKRDLTWLFLPGTSKNPAGFQNSGSHCKSVYPEVAREILAEEKTSWEKSDILDFSQPYTGSGTSTLKVGKHHIDFVDLLNKGETNTSYSKPTFVIKGDGLEPTNDPDVAGLNLLSVDDPDSSDKYAKLIKMETNLL